jgi:transposase-like protein
MITLYGVCADVLDMIEVRETPQVVMTSAEVMTTALVAARFFGGCLERSRAFLKDEHYNPWTIRETLGEEVNHRCNPYLNNRIEQDHRGIKQRSSYVGVFIGVLEHSPRL